MYLLLEPENKEKIRRDIEGLVTLVSEITGTVQPDQLYTVEFRTGLTSGGKR